MTEVYTIFENALFLLPESHFYSLDLTDINGFLKQSTQLLINRIWGGDCELALGQDNAASTHSGSQ